jgi:hypothetical protein
MDIFSDEDIDMFVDSYQKNLLEDALLNSKIPIWVEFLKTKKHYKLNGMQEDYFFKKRFNITTPDLVNIHNLMDRIKRGKTLLQPRKTNIEGNMSSNNQNLYSLFDESEDYEKDANKFELLSEVKGAMDDYYKKMKKNSKKKLEWKKKAEDNSVDGIVNRYYNDDINSERSHMNYETNQINGPSEQQLYLRGNNNSNIMAKIDKINDILAYNNNVQNNRYEPTQSINQDFGCNNKSIYINNSKITENPEAARFWQDQSIMNSGTNTRNSSIKNSQPFEHQFQYLNTNYNQVIDKRLLGESSRLDNKNVDKSTSHFVR